MNTPANGTIWTTPGARPWLALLVGGLLWGGCIVKDGSVPTEDDAEQAGCDPSSSSLTWTDDISVIFDRHCNDCHAIANALVPALLTYDDVTATNDAGVPLYERCAVRMREQNMPPPNVEPMSPEEREAVIEWVEACAPE